MGQFLIVEFNLPTLDHQVPSNFMLILKYYILERWRIDGVGREKGRGSVRGDMRQVDEAYGVM